jgi:hypothetical protein
MRVLETRGSEKVARDEETREAVMIVVIEMD